MCAKNYLLGFHGYHQDIFPNGYKLYEYAKHNLHLEGTGFGNEQYYAWK
jgi:hypothetical protein